jgi:hypothetical protein
MRALILAGSTAVILTLGASSVYANGPLGSPYEMLYPTQADPVPAQEGRASYTGDQNGAVAPQHHSARRHHRVPTVDVVQ